MKKFESLLITHLTKVEYACIFVLIFPSPKTCCKRWSRTLEGCSTAYRCFCLCWARARSVCQLQGSLKTAPKHDDCRGCEDSQSRPRGSCAVACLGPLHTGSVEHKEWLIASPSGASVGKMDKRQGSLRALAAPPPSWWGIGSVQRKKLIAQDQWLLWGNGNSYGGSESVYRDKQGGNTKSYVRQM